MALQMSDVDCFIMGVGEVSLIIACIPIQGNNLKMSLMPSILLPRQHFKISKITAGAAIIVPYMYNEVTIETIRKQIITLPKNQILRKVDVSCFSWKK